MCSPDVAEKEKQMNPIFVTVLAQGLEELVDIVFDEVEKARSSKIIEVIKDLAVAGHAREAVVDLVRSMEADDASIDEITDALRARVVESEDQAQRDINDA